MILIGNKVNKIYPNTFYNATPLFKDVIEQTYVDGGGHLNKLGNEILGAYVARLINKIYKL